MSSLENFPQIAKVYTDGYSITGLELAITLSTQLHSANRRYEMLHKMRHVEE